MPSTMLATWLAAVHLQGGSSEEARQVLAHRPFIGDVSRPSTAWHAEFGDVDNDGRDDLFIAKGNVDQMPSNAAKDPNNLLMQHQDGTFAAKLFDGEYKLVLKQNTGPWRNDPDTTVVMLNGSESLDVPVEPYFVATGESFTLDGTTLTATFDVSRVVEGSELEHVGLYVGESHFVDSRYNAARVEETVDLEASSGRVTLT